MAAFTLHSSRTCVVLHHHHLLLPTSSIVSVARSSRRRWRWLSNHLTTFTISLDAKNGLRISVTGPASACAGEFPAMCSPAPSSLRSILWNKISPSLLLASPIRPSLTLVRWHLPISTYVLLSSRRGAKTKTFISLEDLPQGPLMETGEQLTLEYDPENQEKSPSKNDEFKQQAKLEDLTDAEDVPLKSRGRSRRREAASCKVEAAADDTRFRPQYSTVIQQARDNMDKFVNCVVLTRVGGFYELYFEQAEQYGPLLNLRVSQKRSTAGPIPMAGFPFYQIDRYLKILVRDLCCSVAISDESPNDPAGKVRTGGLMHDRKVTRVITPGTLIDENFIDPFASNYILSIYLPERDKENKYCQEREAFDDGIKTQNLTQVPAEAAVGLAWLDLTTGQFFTQTVPLSSVMSVLSRVSPIEIVLDTALESDESHTLLLLLSDEKHLISYSMRCSFPNGPPDWNTLLETPIPGPIASSFTAEEVDACNLLLHYVKDRLQGLSMKLHPPVRYNRTHMMEIDKTTMRALEIKQTMRDGAFRGSLLHAVRRTITKGGARLLSEWLSTPSTSINTIKSRQDIVELFTRDHEFRQAVVYLLKRTHDLQRLVQKFALGRGDWDDLIGIASTIYTTEELVTLLKNSYTALIEQKDSPLALADALKELTERLNIQGPLKLAHRIKDAVDEEAIKIRHRIEDEEAGAMLAFAEKVVTAVGSEEDAAAILPKRSIANPDGKMASKKKISVYDQETSSVTIRNGRGTPVSLREHYAEDSENWMMKSDASITLSRLHAHLSDIKKQKEELEISLRERFAIQTLTLKWTPGLGHICHVKGRSARVLAQAIAKISAPDGDGKRSRTAPPLIPQIVSSSRSTRSFHVAEWTVLGQELDEARLRIRAEESRVFNSLRQAVVRNLVLLRRNAGVLDELDVTSSFAVLALEKDLVRPIVRDDPATGHNIIGGRHLTVEGGLDEQGRMFVRNDCFVGSSQGTGKLKWQGKQQPQHGRVWLITGPNMGGKSTFLRQNALITVLAQSGCFVPATFCEVGIVDKLFSRVGSADSLYNDQSTFMMEMLETAAILRQATRRSFVIMDEIGRGTSPQDGEAVAFATLQHLALVNKCRVLFATHFYGVVDMVEEAGLGRAAALVASAIEGKGARESVREQRTLKMGVASAGIVDMYCTDVEENHDAGGFVFVHRLRRGVNRRSHALKVAQLAGMPPQAMEMIARAMKHRVKGKGCKKVARHIVATE